MNENMHRFISCTIIRNIVYVTEYGKSLQLSQTRGCRRCLFAGRNAHTIRPRWYYCWLFVEQWMYYLTEFKQTGQFKKKKQTCLHYRTLLIQYTTLMRLLHQNVYFYAQNPRQSSLFPPFNTSNVGKVVLFGVAGTFILYLKDIL